MSDNPYQPPQADFTSPTAADRIDRLAQLAADYRTIAVNLLISAANHAAFLTWLGWEAWDSGTIPVLVLLASPSGMSHVLALFGLATLVNLLFALWVAPRLYPPLIGYLLAFFSIVPLIGMLTWGLFRRRSAALLDNERVRTGLFDADPTDLACRSEEWRGTLLAAGESPNLAQR